MVTSPHKRVAKEMQQVIDSIRAEYVMKGKKAPSCAQITKAMVEKYKISKEDLLYDRLIKL